MIRATDQLNKSIEAGAFDPIGILTKRLEGEESKGPSCEIKKIEPYVDPGVQDHERQE